MYKWLLEIAVEEVQDNPLPFVPEIEPFSQYYVSDYEHADSLGQLVMRITLKKRYDGYNTPDTIELELDGLASSEWYQFCLNDEPVKIPRRYWGDITALVQTIRGLIDFRIEYEGRCTNKF